MYRLYPWEDRNPELLAAILFFPMKGGFPINASNPEVSFEKTSWKLELPMKRYYGYSFFFFLSSCNSTIGLN